MYFQLAAFCVFRDRWIMLSVCISCFQFYTSTQPIHEGAWRNVSAELRKIIFIYKVKERDERK